MRRLSKKETYATIALCMEAMIRKKSILRGMLRFHICFFLYMLLLCSCTHIHYEDTPCTHALSTIPTHKDRDLIDGVVVRGKQEARQLGFPTANMQPFHGNNLKNVQDGVYRCKVFLGSDVYRGMCYRDQTRHDVIEAHIFGYEGSLYDKNITIMLETFIRAPVKDISFDEIKALIQKDARLCTYDILLHCGSQKPSCKKN